MNPAQPGDNERPRLVTTDLSRDTRGPVKVLTTSVGSLGQEANADCMIEAPRPSTVPGCHAPHFRLAEAGRYATPSGQVTRCCVCNRMPFSTLCPRPRRCDARTHAVGRLKQEMRRNAIGANPNGTDNLAGANR